MSASRPLPGIRFETAPSASDPALPRMDIAAFVGFASTGPLHLPVAIESVAQFAAVFGGAAVLAWDAQRQQAVAARLGPAVRTFFSNGGRRCWVVRVARSATLEALLRRRGAHPVDPPGIARCNGFALSGVLALARTVDGPTVGRATARARSAGSWSDRLRVSTAATADGLVVDAVSTAPDWTLATSSAVAVGDLLRLDDDAGLQAYTAVTAVSTGSTGPVARLDAPTFFRTPLHDGTVLRGRADLGPVSAIAARLTPAPDQDATLKLVGGVALLPADGDWIMFDDEVGGHWWFAIARAVEVRRAALSRAYVATFAGSVWQELGADAVGTPDFTHATRIELALGVADGDAAMVEASGLGLDAAHPRWWNATPDDDAWYAGADAVAAARFPLAGDGTATTRLLPLGVGAAYGPGMQRATGTETALERDGLSRFGPDLFLDPDLAGLGVDTIVETADFLRYLDVPPRRLLGIHAVFGFDASTVADEATIVAIPDAMHPGWVGAAASTQVASASKRFPRPEWLGLPCPPSATDAATTTPKRPDRGRFLDGDLVVVHRPRFLAMPADPAAASFTLRWTAITPRPDRYVLEEARRADWSDARVVYTGAASSFDVLGRGSGDDAGRTFYRVRALRDEVTSDWSKGIGIDVRTDRWLLRPTDDFDADDAAGLLDLHRATLRLCAAKGDLFAVLAMPSHFREDAALAYARRLGAEVAASSPAPAVGAALSYGAIYHPWLTEVRDSGGTIDTPPDGAAAGVIAARAARRGAWIAPANEALKDVVALTPVLSTDRRQDFQDARINLLRQEPRGFVVLCADTLSIDPDLRPINVRRLLILLRKVALRRGANYVFEANGSAFRRTVRRSFERLMDDLFLRGAFAGTTAATSYRVRIGDDLNTAQSVDGGRLIVELKVAPAAPMSFLTVVLQQVGERLTVAESL